MKGKKNKQNKKESKNTTVNKTKIAQNKDDIKDFLLEIEEYAKKLEEKKKIS